MKSRPRRSHSYWEGVMMFQRGGSIRPLQPTPSARRFASFARSLPCWALCEPQQGIEVFLPKKPVAVDRMPVCDDLACPLPVAQRVRRDAEVVGGVRNSQVVTQLDHALASTSAASVIHACSTLPKSVRVARV